MKPNITIIVTTGAGSLGKSNFAQKSVAEYVAEQEKSNKQFKSEMTFEITRLMDDDLKEIVILPMRGVIPPNFYKNKLKRK